MRRVVLFVAASLDGYIATREGGIDWLSLVERAGEDYGYGAFIKTVETVLMGRKTYDKVLSFGIPFPHQDKECFVFTRSPRPVEGTVQFISEDPAILVSRLREKEGGTIFLDGGAGLIREFMQRDLIDDFIISVIPVLLGDGIPLFHPLQIPERKLSHLSSRSYPSGLVQMHFERSRS